MDRFIVVRIKKQDCVWAPCGLCQCFSLFKLLSCWILIYPAFANSVDPDQLASKKPTDLDLHCLLFSMWIYINNPDQVIWLAENSKRVWHLNLFSRTRVKNSFIQCYNFRWDFKYLLITLFIFFAQKLQLKSLILQTIRYQLNKNHCQISSLITGVRRRANPARTYPSRLSYQLVRITSEKWCL